MFIKLYEMGKISSRTAARRLNMSRLQFMDLHSEYNDIVYEPQSNENFISELNNTGNQ